MISTLRVNKDCVRIRPEVNNFPQHTLGASTRTNRYKYVKIELVASCLSSQDRNKVDTLTFVLVAPSGTILYESHMFP